VRSFLGNVSFVKSATVFRYLFVVLNHPKLQTSTEKMFAIDQNCTYCNHPKLQTEKRTFQEFNDATGVTPYYDRSKL
jgi:hypothetical protein